MSAEISVIIPQFGQADLTVRCVESLLEFHSVAGALEFLIVDDGSPRCELQKVQAQSFPQTSLIRNSQNRGVTFSWNRGAALAAGQTLIFLNNDVVSQGAWCQQLSQAIETRQSLIAGPELRIEPRLPKTHASLFSKKQLLSGWCFAISRELFYEFKGFDLRYRMYFSDTDLQMQVVQRFGSSQAIREVPDLPVIHHGHQTTRHLLDRSRQWSADREAFVKKWHS